MVAGLQLPLIPLGEVVARIGATEPEQNAGIAAKLGVNGVFTVTVTLVVAVLPDDEVTVTV